MIGQGVILYHFIRGGGGGCEESVTSNYRGISITSCLGKLFSAVLCKRLYNEIETNNLISKYQIGFVKGKRTSDHIFVLKYIIEEYKSKKRPVYACFVDLKKAYDTIWRDGLFYKLLYNHKLSPTFELILQSMYSNLESCVKIDGSVSKFFALTIGLRQGCNLSPHLFNMYIDDLSRVLERIDNDPVKLNGTPISCLMYADDMI